jgi:hypothetical protein
MITNHCVFSCNTRFRFGIHTLHAVYNQPAGVDRSARPVVSLVRWRHSSIRFCIPVVSCSTAASTLQLLRWSVTHSGRIKIVCSWTHRQLRYFAPAVIGAIYCLWIQSASSLTAFDPPFKSATWACILTVTSVCVLTSTGWHLVVSPCCASFGVCVVWSIQIIVRCPDAHPSGLRQCCGGRWTSVAAMPALAGSQRECSPLLPGQQLWPHHCSTVRTQLAARSATHSIQICYACLPQFKYNGPFVSERCTSSCCFTAISQSTIVVHRSPRVAAGW